LKTPELEGSRVYYDFWWAGGGQDAKVFRFDLERCEEQQLSLGGNASRFGISDDVLIYGHYPDDTPHCPDLYAVDLSDLSVTALLDSPACESRPRTNGRHLTYYWKPDEDSPGEYRLRDMQLGTDETLFPYVGMKSPNLSDRYLVWTALDPIPGSEGSDVFVRDLATGDTTRLEASLDKWQDWIFVWDDWVTWSGAEGDLVPPYHLVLYNLVTREATRLLENDYSVSIAPIRDGLVAYNTSRYTGTTALDPSDIEIYDLQRRIRRRVTASPGFLRAARIDPPYLLMAFAHGQALMYDLYVVNLERLGVLDENGRLIPGDGVLVFP
jgi:hypothetical protein